MSCSLILNFSVLLIIFLLNSTVLYSQFEPRVNLIANKVNIHQWEKVTFKARLNYQDSSAYYIFSINNIEISSDNNWRNEITVDEFSLGQSLIKVKVISINNVISDSIRVNVRKVGLSTNPESIRIGDKVSFSCDSLDQNNIKYRFNFGDNLPPGNWGDNSQTTYIYMNPGDYEVYAEIGKFNGTELYSMIKSESKKIKVKLRPTYQIKLSVDTTYAQPGEIVTFKAIVTRQSFQKFRFRFDFGDDTRTKSQSAYETTHRYKNTGDYKVTVYLLNDEEDILDSASLIMNILESDEETYLLLLWIFISSAILLSVLLKIKYVAKPKIIFKTKPDLGNQTLIKDNESLIDLIIKLSSEASKTKYSLSFVKDKLIDEIRREI